MEFVEAIKDREKIKVIKEILFHRSKRDYLLFTFGINTGLKISEILNIKIHEIMDHNKIKQFYVLEGKEERAIYLNDQVKVALNAYFNELPTIKEDEYLFRSKKSELPITRQQAYRIINAVAREAGIESKIGTHTLRKTFGYHAYRSGVAISLLQKIFHHSSRRETLKYIGVDNMEIMHPKIDVNL
ncbi:MULTISPECIES: tyrosine-type recombinase/integrase [Bacillaceae]|uniref:Tyrosine-type recombinase/integrase n=1 Tax=Evansella alkalicola TaxID=745819 RepID=A0ABS6JQT6_9BACI|nr:MULTISPECIES: tyrosine-type recombinase/integrase [Bacillaceae]MBU9720909.1 tyrosine-type recombinase/integrase [Bacillus alkalicola]